MHHWLSAIRLRTLPLAVACIALGTLLAEDHGGMSWPVAILAVLTAAVYQILSNLSNDLGDGLKGTDDHRPEGVEKRALASGQLSVGQLQRAVQWATILAVILTLVTATVGTTQMGWMWRSAFVVFGLLATLAARSYTLGIAYGYQGYGDLFALVFFGPLAVWGSFTLQVQGWQPLILLAGLGVGMLAAAVLNLNNMRDIETDAMVGKRTLAMRMGLKAAKQYQRGLVLGAYVAAGAYVWLQAPLTCSRSFLFVAVLPLMLSGLRDMRKASNPAQLDALLKPLALQTALFAIMLGVGLLIDSNACAAP